MVGASRDALTAHYTFTIYVVDVACRIRTQAGSRVRDDMVILVACRLVWNSPATLFRADYDGFPNSQDDDLLMAALAADERAFPYDYKSHSDIVETVRCVQPRDDDMVLALDFVDPQIGFRKDNILTVTKRTIRLRDRATMDELDSVSAWYLAHKVAGETKGALLDQQ